ncbi:MAG: CotH kinase family protein [Oscillospiraceae bacterium]|nr:CotH kinase family protein [Oscillospiraceae bacterium]
MKKAIPVLFIIILFLCLPQETIALEQTDSAAVQAESGRGLACLSEVMTKNKAAFQDPDGDFSDWVEIRNTAGRDLDLEGWSLSKNGGKRIWVFPSCTLQAGSQIVVFAARKDSAGSALCTGFALSDGDRISLCDRNGTPVSFCSIKTDRSDYSLASDDTGCWTTTPYPTPGEPNSAEGYERAASARRPAGPLVINEVCVDNFTFFYQEPLGYSDWVELKNISSETVDLSQFCLSDNLDSPDLYRLSGTLPPGGFLVILCNKESSLSSSAEFQMAPFSLNAENEQLYLSTIRGELIDYASLREIPYKGTYGRVPGQEGFFYLRQESPGLENSSGERRVSAVPTLEGRDGLFENVSSVSVTLTAPGEIRYTLDGSRPTDSSVYYSGPITLTETTVLRAVCIEQGALPSRPVTFTYLLNEGHTLPVVSLASDDRDSFQEMYINGLKGIEIPGNIAWYEGKHSFSLGCGIKMHGDTSLVLPKKNMSVRFRGSYGAEQLDYDLFDGGVTTFTNLLLRAGQDQSNTIVRNEACYSLTDDFTDAVVSERFQYCVLYINGIYKGIYALMEKPNEAFYASLHGIEKKDVKMEEASVFHGSLYTDAFANLYSDMKKEENFQPFASVLDLESLADWSILEGTFGNYDLAEGNLRYAQDAANGGKWQLILYDLDCAFYSTDFCMNNVLTYGSQVSMVNAKLLENPAYRKLFLSRAGEAFRSVLTQENICRKLDELAAVVAPEVERDSAFSGMTYSSWQEHLDSLKNRIRSGWTELCVERICDFCKVTPKERKLYFSNLPDLTP